MSKTIKYCVHIKTSLRPVFEDVTSAIPTPVCYVLVTLNSDHNPLERNVINGCLSNFPIANNTCSQLIRMTSIEQIRQIITRSFLLLVNLFYY